VAHGGACAGARKFAPAPEKSAEIPEFEFSPRRLPHSASACMRPLRHFFLWIEFFRGQPSSPFLQA
jgi:hypothetical protein